MAFPTRLVRICRSRPASPSRQSGISSATLNESSIDFPADRTVLAPVRQLLGLDKVLFCTSGAAALPVEVLYFLAGLGLEIREVWGLSETTGAVTTNHARAFRAGTVGQVVPDSEVKVAEDGELLVRGPLVFLGYLQEDGSIEPVTDDEGWFATGDIGTIDADGFVTITDRKKELIITSGGKNIAPTRIEGLLKEHPLIGQAWDTGAEEGHNDSSSPWVMADLENGLFAGFSTTNPSAAQKITSNTALRLPYVTALIVLDEESLPGWAGARGIEYTDAATLASHPAVREEIDQAVQSANSRLARVEQIKRYRLLAKPWSPESGELTPTLKLKRRIINSRYAPDIEALYTS